MRFGKSFSSDLKKKKKNPWEKCFSVAVSLCIFVSTRQVSAQQSEMDGKFAAMHRTVLLLKKYGQILPEKTQYLFSAAPGRWSNLKTKVSLAKQRLGPRIQEESASISQVGCGKR